MRTRPGLKLLGLSALVMGMMAIGTAGVAQAEEGACWGYEKNGLQCFSNTLEATPLLAIEEISGTHPKAATLLVGNVNMEVTCKTAKIVGEGTGGRLAANGTVLKGKVLFGECFTRTKTTLALLPACTPEDNEDGLGTVVTEFGEGLIVLHETAAKVKEPVVRFKPSTGTLLAVVEMPECSVATALEVRGELVLADVGGKAGAEEHKLEHLIIEHPTLHLMTVGGLSALIDGSANVTLAGEHNALKWGSKTTK